jgi:hypothetical protein
MVNALLQLGLRRALGVLAISFVVIGLVSAGLMRWLEPPHPVRLNVRWTADVDDARRGELERQLRLTRPRHSEGATFIYQLDVPSTDAIRTIVQHPSVDDTAHINRSRFRPEFEQDRERRSIFYGVLGGGVGAVAVLLWLAKRRSEAGSAQSPTPDS